MSEKLPASDEDIQSAVSQLKSGNFKVTVTDIELPFMSMVALMVKWALAAIPAILILMVVWGVALGLFGGLFGRH